MPTQLLHNNFIDNYSNGFGGAIRLGSPPSFGGGCPKTVIRSARAMHTTSHVTARMDGNRSPQLHLNCADFAGNTFHNNRATISGAAIFSSYCNNTRSTSWTNNIFRGNTATQFPGTLGLNALTLPSAEPASIGPVPAGAGCPRPTLTSNSFGKSDTIYSPPWYVLIFGPELFNALLASCHAFMSRHLMLAMLLQVLPLTLDEILSGEPAAM